MLIRHYMPIVLNLLASTAAMSKCIFLFATIVANEYGHSPHFKDIAIITSLLCLIIYLMQLTSNKFIRISKNEHPGPTLFKICFFIGRCEIKFLILSETFPFCSKHTIFEIFRNNAIRHI